MGDKALWLTLAEVCRRLGISEKTGRAVVKELNLAAIQLGKRKRYSAEAVARLGKAA
jgi:excisionase family DNA binding protein